MALLWINLEILLIPLRRFVDASRISRKGDHFQSYRPATTKARLCWMIYLKGTFHYLELTLQPIVLSFLN